jgi:hypothetical protein
MEADAAAMHGFGQREAHGDMAHLSLDCFSGNMALGNSALGATRARGLGTVAQAWEPGQSSLQEACRNLALQRALQLWRLRLHQHQQAT